LQKATIIFMTQIRPPRHSTDGKGILASRTRTSTYSTTIITASTAARYQNQPPLNERALNPAGAVDIIST
jgi:hypothetical protein